MEAPGVPRGAAPVRGPPSSCTAQSGAGAQAPLFPPLLSALAVPPEADLGSPRGPGSTLHPGSTTSGTSRDQGHVQDGHAPCPDRGNTRLPLWRKTQEADTCSSPQTSGFLISETRFLPVSERREPCLQRNVPHSRSPLSPCPLPTETRCTPGQPRSGRPRTSS